MPVSDVDVDDEIEELEDALDGASDARDGSEAEDDEQPDAAAEDETDAGDEDASDAAAEDETDAGDEDDADAAEDEGVIEDSDPTDEAEAESLPGWQPPDGGDVADRIDPDAWGITADDADPEADDSGDAEPGWQRPEGADVAEGDLDETEQGSDHGDADAADDFDGNETAAEADAADEPAQDEDEEAATGGDDSIDLDRVLDEHLVTMMYQPITSLLDDSIVGYEALARGPQDSQLATPAAMFKAAAEQGKMKELDLLCQAQAVIQAKDVLLKSGHALFVNVEPTVLLDAALGRDLDAAEQVSSLLTNITSACPVVLEISDSYEYQSPADLLAVTIWARVNGFRVALDDVDVSTRNLAMLPLIEPDVIKLAHGVLAAPPDADLGLLLRAVRSQSERTGAAVVCQGIESDEDHARALSLGATHAEGFGIGLPKELSEAPIRIRSLEPVSASWGEPCSSPFELVANSSQLRTGSEDLVLALTLDLERQAANHDNAAILSAFERLTSSPGEIGARYQKLARKVDFAVLLGEGLGKRKGIFHGEVETTDALCSERAVVVLTPQFSAALLARIAGGDERDRQYAFALIYDRGQVTRAARMLMSYIDIDVNAG